MLILAGVSLNAIIGDNGIITNAQNASIMQSIADLQEFFSEYYVSNFDDIEKLGLENKAEALSTYSKSKKWFYKPSDDGYGNLNYIVDSSGNAYFLLNKKEFLKTHQDFDLRGGDTGEGTYADYNELNDVYGLNSRLEVYYITKNSDGSLNIMGTQSIDKDNPNRIVFATGSSYANFVSTMVPNPDINNDGEISASEAATIDTIEITSTHFMELDELYNFPALKTLKLQDIELDSLDGLKNLRLLEYLSFTNVTVTEGGSFAGIKANTRLNYLYVLQTNDNFVKSLFTQMKDVTYSKLEYIGIYSNGTNITNTSIDLMKDFQSGTKGAVKKLYLNSNYLANVEFLNGYTALEYLTVSYNSQLASLKGVKSASLVELNAVFCNLGSNENDYDITKENNGMNEEEDSLGCLTYCKKLKTLNVQYNKIKWLSYINNNTVSFDYLYLLGNSTFNQGEVASIKGIYNATVTKNINEEYKKYLNDSDLYNFGRSVDSIAIASLQDSSEEIVSLQNLSQADKNLVKSLDLSGNNLLTSGKISELLSGIKSDGTSTGKGNFGELIYLNLNDTQIDTLYFLEYLPKLRQLKIANTNVGLEPDEESLYCSEFAKIDLYCQTLVGLDVSSDYVDIEDIDEYVCRAIDGLKWIQYGEGLTSNAKYIRNNWPVSLTKQLGRLGTRFPTKYRCIGPKFPTDSLVNISSCTNLNNMTLDSDSKFILPSSLKTFNSMQNPQFCDISNCTSLSFSDFRESTAIEYEEWLKQIQDYGISVSKMQLLYATEGCR